MPRRPSPRPPGFPDTQKTGYVFSDEQPDASEPSVYIQGEKMSFRYSCPTEVRPEMRDFVAYTPGLTIDEIRERYHLERVIKLASNENPLGTSPLVQKAIKEQAAAAFRYPRGGFGVAEALARHHAVNPERIVVGNGSDELIDLLIRVRAVPGVHNALGFKPCFNMYPVLSKLCGVEFRQVPLNKDFSFPWNALADKVDENTALIFVTTPDNPSGFCPPVEDIMTFAAGLPAGTFLVVDEAYMDFCDNEEAHSVLPRLSEMPNTGVLRTFSKSFGLAGIRLGYAVLPQPLAEAARKARSPFSVNILAEAAGVAALRDTDFRKETLRITREGREFLSTELGKLGFAVYPSQANFIMVKPPEGIAAAALYTSLLERGIIIRQLKSGYDLPDFLRITIGTREENSCLTLAVKEILHA